MGLPQPTPDPIPYPTSADRMVIAATLHQRHPERFETVGDALECIAEVVDFLAHGSMPVYAEANGG